MDVKDNGRLWVDLSRIGRSWVNVRGKWEAVGEGDRQMVGRWWM